MENGQMVRRMALTVCLLGGCVWCLAVATRADSAQAQTPGTEFKPVAPVDALMHGQMVFFKEITEQLGKPAGKDRNHEIEESAEVLAELANVNRHNKDKDDYRGWATTLRDTALELAKAAEKEGGEGEAQMQKLVQTLKSTCAACHDVYRP